MGGEWAGSCCICGANIPMTTTIAIGSITSSIPFIIMMHLLIIINITSFSLFRRAWFNHGAHEAGWYHEVGAHAPPPMATYRAAAPKARCLGSHDADPAACLVRRPPRCGLAGGAAPPPPLEAIAHAIATVSSWYCYHYWYDWHRHRQCHSHRHRQKSL